MVLHLTGTPGAGFYVVVPTNKKIYIVDNASGQTATVKTTAGTGSLPTEPGPHAKGTAFEGGWGLPAIMWWPNRKAPHSARKSWIYNDGETFQGARVDIGGDPNEPWVNIAWKMLYTAKDSWLGPTENLGAIPALYNLTMDPYEKYDMTFNGAAPTRRLTTSPGRYSGQDNAWVSGIVGVALMEFDKSIMKSGTVEKRR